MPNANYRTTTQHSIFTGAGKSIPLNALPEAAWEVINGKAHGDDNDMDERELRKSVATLRRCLDIRADSVSSVPWVVTDESDNELWTSEDPLPPPDLAWADDLNSLLNLTELSLCIHSEAFWHIQRAKKFGKPVPPVSALRWLAARTMEPVWDKDAGLTHFLRQLSPNDKRRLELENVVYIWSQDPDEETKPASSPLMAAASAARVLANMDGFIAAFWARGAIKATLLTLHGNPAPQEKSRLREWWNRAFNGKDNAFATEVVNADAVTPVTIGEGVKELSNADLTDEKQQQIAIAFGIPLSMLFKNAANFATASQDKRNFYDETILPELKVIERPVNRTLFNPFGYRFRFRYDSMDIYQEDEQKRADAFAQYVAAGMKRSVAGEMLGVKLPVGMTYAMLDEYDPRPISLSSAGQPTPEAFQTAEEGQGDASGNASGGGTPKKSLNTIDEDLRKWERKALNRLNRGQSAAAPFESDVIPSHISGMVAVSLLRASNAEEVKAVFEEAHDRPTRLSVRRHIASLLRPSEAGMEELRRLGIDIDEIVKAVPTTFGDDEDPVDRAERAKIERGAIRKLEKALAESVDEALSGPDGKPLGAPTDSVEDVDLVALAGAPERMAAATHTRVADVLAEALRESADLGVRMTVDRLDEFGLAFDWTQANLAARDWALAHSAQTIAGISTTSTAAVQQAIATWIENGLPLSALRDDLTPLFGSARAELIASTEVTRAFAEANRIAYRESGLVGKMEWRTAVDERVCPVCGALNERQVGLDESFSEGFEVPPAHPRCRCILAPVIDRALIATAVTS